MQHCFILLFSNIFITIVLAKYDNNKNSGNAITTKTFAIWKNGVVPFYVNPAHFDHEQTLSILSALSMFAFKTCIKFKPVMARPEPTDEVMVFINPDGAKRCHFETGGHSVYNSHFVKIGYECLKPPLIEMMVMRALGFPFEHNRDNRDLFIAVLNENIEPGNMELFTKEDVLPLELRFLPYDVNSVMHFGNRDFSKNGHRTFIFKDPSVKQNRVGLTDTDIKKIEIVYGPECRARDRQEKVELCQSYPGVARKKRQLTRRKYLIGRELPRIERKKRDIDLDKMVSMSLRVNPEITPPPNQSENITKTLKELGIDEAVQEIVEQVHKVSSLALKNARIKYCNDTKDKTPGDIKIAREGDVKARDTPDILGIIEIVADLAKGMVDHAIRNLTKFCENSEALEVYQRFSCGLSISDPRCRQSFKSTKSGAVKYSTQHRPLKQFPTGHNGGYKPKKNYARAGNETKDDEETTTQSVRRKRDVETTTIIPKFKDELKTTDNHQMLGEPLIKLAIKNKDQSENKEDTGDKEIVANNNKNIEENIKEGVKQINKIDENIEKAIVNEEKIADNSTKNILNNTEKTVINQEKSGRENKKQVVEAESDDIKVKSEEKVNNKESLRSGTMIPGYKDRISRRSHGDDRRFKSNLYHLDAFLNKKITAVKHVTQKISEREKIYVDDSDEDDSAHTKRERRERKRKRQKKEKQHLKEAHAKTDDSQERGEKLDSEKLKFRNPVSEAIVKKEPKGSLKIKKKSHVTEEDQDGSDTAENIMEESDTDEQSPPRRPHLKKKKKADKKILPATVALSKKNKEFYDERSWPDGLLVYMIQDDTTYDLWDMRERLAEVNDILKEKTCVRMKEIKPRETNKYEDYIVIDNSPDYVTGRVGGEQRFGSIELFRGGQHRQHAAMMVMAMLGFYFEVARHDREKYIRVHMRHVRPDKLHHFEMIRSDATLPLPYDYASATHPAWQFWRHIGRKGISTVATYKSMDPDGSVMKSLGQNEKILSDIDIVKINSVYGVECFRYPRSTGNIEQQNKRVHDQQLRNKNKFNWAITP